MAIGESTALDSDCEQGGVQAVCLVYQLQAACQSPRQFTHREKEGERGREGERGSKSTQLKPQVQVAFCDFQGHFEMVCGYVAVWCICMWYVCGVCGVCGICTWHLICHTRVA